ncbi:MAG: hypothetical protein M1274_02310 [Actinobacteria bacterium]|nr:hypothetical protein [Actinomycetota bacterium]
MLFVTLGTPVAGSTTKQRVARRLQWSYPPGSNIIAEYWLQTTYPTLIVISEADSIAPIMAATTEWDDMFSFTTVPAVTAEEGMEMAKKMMPQA